MKDEGREQNRTHHHPHLPLQKTLFLCPASISKRIQICSAVSYSQIPGARRQIVRDLQVKIDAEKRRLRHRKRDSHDNLPVRIDIAIDQKVMVTANLETNLDIANGAHGVISGIVRNPAESPLGDGDVVELKYMPAYILVKLDHTLATGLAGLEDQRSRYVRGSIVRCRRVERCGNSFR